MIGKHDDCQKKDCLCASENHDRREENSKPQNQIIQQLQQVLIKEQIDEVQPSKLEPDFFKKINQYRLDIDLGELKKIDLLLRKIRDIRIGKIIFLIDVKDMRKIKDRLTDEECQFWERITESQNILKTSTLWEVCKH